MDWTRQHLKKSYQLFFKQNLLGSEGMMVIEHSKYTKLDQMPHFSFQKSYGGSIFSFFALEASE